MRILDGKNVIEVMDITDKIAEYESLAIDIGTGDGKFVYKLAKENPTKFFIGIDSVGDNMKELAVKIKKKPLKGGLSNVLYSVANAEALPQELENKVSNIYINMPWGSLLEGLVKPTPIILENIVKIAAPHIATVEINFTYSRSFEEGEILKRELPELSLEYIENVLIPEYEKMGISILDKSIVDNDALKQLGTQWSKRLGFGRSRDVFSMKGIIEK